MLQSCKKDNNEDVYNYYPSGELKAVHHKKNNFIEYFDKKGNIIYTVDVLDSLNVIKKTYHKNKNVETKFPLYREKINGWCYYYNEKGELLKKEEIFTINNKPSLNQRIVYLKNGKINTQKSTYFEIILDDTLKIGRHIGVLKFYSEPTKKSKFTVYICNDSASDYSLYTKTKLDSFPSNKIDDIWFGVENKKEGKRTIKGYLEEQFYEVNKDSTELTITKEIRYFKKNIVVVK